MSTPNEVYTGAPLPIDVVSIQSQVIYGGVGNNAAVPTLQAHGLTVAAVPTVLLSNTPHYPSLYGGAIPLDWLRGYLQALRERGGLRTLRAVLMGYLGGAEQVDALTEWLDQLHAEQPQVPVVIDPVIGDHDSGVYVDPAMIRHYREQLLPHAHGLTPNGFELGCLSGLPVENLDQVVIAARSIMGPRAQWVVVTSAAPAHCDFNRIQVAVVTPDEVHIVRHAKVARAPKGTGDLFSAELTARLLEGQPLLPAVRQACRRVMSTIRNSNAVGSGELLLRRKKV